MNNNFEFSPVKTKYGDFTLYVWSGKEGKEPIALVTPLFNPNEAVLVRVHSECLTGDIFESLCCDCGEQKDLALKIISESSNGIFIYHRQEGRGIGLFEKVRALKLQHEGLDTYEANIHLGHLPDARTYRTAYEILDTLNVRNIRLITNNPQKIREIESFNIRVIDRVPLIVKPNSHNAKYLKAKKIKGKHFL